jgi:hypothetical protein
LLLSKLLFLNWIAWLAKALFTRILLLAVKAA